MHDSIYMKGFRAGKSIDKKEISGLGLGVVRRKWGMTAPGYRISFWSDANILKLIMEMVAQFC